MFVIISYDGVIRGFDHDDISYISLLQYYLIGTILSVVIGIIPVGILIIVIYSYFNSDAKKE